jgi:hypothetical protein
MNHAVFLALRDAVFVAQFYSIQSIERMRQELRERGHGERVIHEAVGLWIGQSFKFMNLENYTVVELTEMVLVFNDLVKKYPNNKTYQRHLQKLKQELSRDRHNPDKGEGQGI